MFTTATNKQALDRMEKENVSALAVVDAENRFRGVVENGKINRRKYEAATFTAIRDHIKCGNLAIRGSKPACECRRSTGMQQINLVS